jgi:anti-sigma factor RsiW
MRKLDDDQLVAYLDGELDAADHAEVEAMLADDAELRARLVLLGETTAMVRRAFDDVLHEPVPARLLAAALGEAPTAAPAPAKSADIIAFARPASLNERVRASANRRPWASFALAASILGLVIGTPIGYLFAGGNPDDGNAQVASATPGWLDTLAGYHNLFIASADGAENAVFDVPAGSEKKELPVDIRVPDLKPYDLVFHGARRIVLDGKPAYQFFYGGADHHKAAITVFVTTTLRPELTPTFERRDGVNLIYWRHLGHGYAIAGQADKGTMSSLANDIAWQLRAQ